MQMMVETWSGNSMHQNIEGSERLQIIDLERSVVGQHLSLLETTNFHRNKLT